MRLLQRHDPHPKIYQAYQQTLAVLADSQQPEVALRLFEKSLLVDLGYGLQLDCTINAEPVLPEKNYIFEFGVGLKQAKLQDPRNFSGKSLLALQKGVLVTAGELRDAKRLLRSVLAILLGDRVLKSRELFI